MAHKLLVSLLKTVEDTLSEKDKERQLREGVKAYWGIDSVSAFTRMVRTHSDDILKSGQLTADFCTMYTSFPFSIMLRNTVEAIEEAWEYRSKQPPTSSCDGAPPQLTLSTVGWSWCGMGFTLPQVAELLSFLLENNFNYNGCQFMRQITGLPMGMPAAPRIANLSCYPVEKTHAYYLGPGNSQVVCRYIDDMYSAGAPCRLKTATAWHTPPPAKVILWYTWG